jgi:hypothetical protein
MKPKTLEVAAKIRAMKVGEVHTITTVRERAQWLRESKTLRDAGVITFRLSSKPLEKGGFSVVAVPL